MAANSSEPYVIESSQKANALTQWIITIVLFAVALGIYLFLASHGGVNYDFNSPDFNPLGLIPLAFIFFGAFKLIAAIRASMRFRKFGSSSLILKDRLVTIGETLKGTVRSSIEITPVSPKPIFEVTLKCLETITTTSNMDNKTTTRTTVVWQGTHVVPAAGLSSKSGIPFAIDIPPSCYETSDGRSKGQVGWILQISAPLPGINYYAAFPLEVVAPEHAALMRRNLVGDEEETMPG